MNSIIVAVSKNGVIGNKNNEIPWKLPSDLKRFKSITGTSPIIMGRNTFESIGKVLPNRNNIVVSSTSTNKEGQPRNLFFVKTIMEGLNIAYASMHEEIFFIGGETIYEAVLPYVSRIYLTTVDFVVQNEDIGAKFPTLDRNYWDVVERENITEDNGLFYVYEILERRVNSIPWTIKNT